MENYKVGDTLYLESGDEVMAGQLVAVSPKKTVFTVRVETEEYKLDRHGWQRGSSERWGFRRNHVHVISKGEYAAQLPKSIAEAAVRKARWHAYELHKKGDCLDAVKHRAEKILEIVALAEKRLAELEASNDQTT